MKVVFKSRSDECIEAHDYRDRVTIIIDGKIAFDVSDGEPEDSNLARDFSDCYSVTDLMEAAYDAGKNGETFEIMHELYGNE